jgi:hypothetical protein
MISLRDLKRQEREIFGLTYEKPVLEKQALV